MLPAKELPQLFDSIVNALSAREDTKAYVKGLLLAYVEGPKDLSTESITLRYAAVREKPSFVGFQELADWLFFSRSIFPDHAADFAGLYEAMGQSAYYRCHLLLRKEWPLFGELSRGFGDLVTQLQESSAHLAVGSS
jgi:hypothetical protein